MGDASPEADKLMRSQGVRALPSFHFWKNSNKLDSISGARCPGSEACRATPGRMWGSLSFRNPHPHSHYGHKRLSPPNPILTLHHTTRSLTPLRHPATSPVACSAGAKTQALIEAIEANM